MPAVSASRSRSSSEERPTGADSTCRIPADYSPGSVNERPGKAQSACVIPPLEGRLIRIPAADDGLGVVERQAYAPHLALEQVDGGQRVGPRVGGDAEVVAVPPDTGIRPVQASLEYVYVGLGEHVGRMVLLREAVPSAGDRGQQRRQRVDSLAVPGLRHQLPCLR